MPIRSCYGPKRKAEIVARYLIEPGPHCVMPPHQEADGDRDECCGVPLKREFYQFFYMPRPGADFSNGLYPKEDGSFFVGRHCAEEFFKLLQAENPNLRKPRRFNPLRDIQRQRSGESPPSTDDGDGDGQDDGVQDERLTPLNREVSVIIEMLATVCRTPLALGLHNVLKWLREHPTQDTQDWAVFSVNDAVGAHPDLGGKTLREAMDAERARGGEAWKDFSFTHVERVLRDGRQKSFIDPTAEVDVAGEPMTVVGVYEHVAYVRGAGYDDDAALFPNCAGLRAIGKINLGDELLVRVGQRQKGPVVGYVYGRQQIGVPGVIQYVREPGVFAFLRPDDGSGDVYIPPEVYETMGKPPIGATFTVRTVPTERKPRATWALAIE